mgnify:CR=1 FL=1
MIWNVVEIQECRDIRQGSHRSDLIVLIFQDDEYKLFYHVVDDLVLFLKLFFFFSVFQE